MDRASNAPRATAFTPSSRRARQPLASLCFRRTVCPEAPSSLRSPRDCFGRIATTRHRSATSLRQRAFRSVPSITTFRPRRICSRRSTPRAFAALRPPYNKRLTASVIPWERLEAASAAHLQELCAGDDFTSSAVQTELPRLSDATRNKLTQLSDSYEMILRDLVAQLPMSPRTSRSLIRLQLLGALNWTRVWFKPNKSSPRDIGRQFVRTLRYGLERNRKQSRRTVGRSQ